MAILSVAGRWTARGAKIGPVTFQTSARGAAHDLSDSRWFQLVARGGYAVSGVLHVVIGWIAVRIALSGGSGGSSSADQSGALSEIKETAWGPAFLWFAVVALVALALWQATEAVVGGGARGGDSTKQKAARAKAAAKALVYLALAGLAFGVVTGESGGGGGEKITQSLMSSGAGKVAVAVAGLAIIVVGGYHVYKGVTKKFQEDLAGGPGGQLGRGVIIAGVAGYAAKGVALVVVGGLFVVGAVQADPEKASGLDVALKSLADLPYGKVLLVLVGAGFVAYGVYSFARSRYAKM